MYLTPLSIGLLSPDLAAGHWVIHMELDRPEAIELQADTALAQVLVVIHSDVTVRIGRGKCVSLRTY
jgi:hypothetical protein